MLVDELDDGDELLDAVLERRAGQDQGERRGDLLDAPRDPRAPVLDPLRLVEDHELRRPPADEVEVVVERVVPRHLQERRVRVRRSARATPARHDGDGARREAPHFVLPLVLERGRTDDEDPLDAEVSRAPPARQRAPPRAGRAAGACAAPPRMPRSSRRRGTPGRGGRAVSPPRSRRRRIGRHPRKREARAAGGPPRRGTRESARIAPRGASPPRRTGARRAAEGPRAPRRRAGASPCGAPRRRARRCCRRAGTRPGASGRRRAASGSRRGRTRRACTSPGGSSRSRGRSSS